MNNEEGIIYYDLMNESGLVGRTGVFNSRLDSPESLRKAFGMRSGEAVKVDTIPRRINLSFVLESPYFTLHGCEGHHGVSVYRGKVDPRDPKKALIGVSVMDGDLVKNGIAQTYFIPGRILGYFSSEGVHLLNDGEIERKELSTGDINLIIPRGYLARRFETKSLV